ncbi:uncharacterized protein N7518_006065 [Penicillium psychrosexuale]|uniref:uncharacterized protein n=1 Tax=Penicillium psychrosexuale TaxID=1002107 RepID=UPI002544DF7B|nr:uncharacterized protein N7518_006065 [Penicillium psychrosexuale]KAJ5789054.1 hypothetical protein N7518_006065 [Penicillium psychrosexuale]
MTRVRVGAVQAEPAWLDLAAGVAKTVALIQEAGAKGINVLGFPERTRRGSLYMAQSFINPGGQIVHHRRKIKPTHVERSIWGEGQAESLQTVVDSPFGRIGGLNCWEHLQPLLRFYEYSQGVQIHVASWPAEFPEPKGLKWPFHETDVASRNASQFFAIEGQAFVLPSGGFSMIFGPDGASLVEAPPAGEECILQADINLGDIDYAKAMIDTVGHYSRPDLLSLKVNTEAAKCVWTTGGNPSV